jgi:hypothetical protein
MNKSMVMSVLVAGALMLHPLHATDTDVVFPKGEITFGKGWGNPTYDVERIVGHLWAGTPVSEDMLEGLFEDLSVGGRSEASQGGGNPETYILSDVVEGFGEVLKEISESRRENKQHIDNIEAFIDLVHQLEGSADPEILTDSLAMIADRF